MPPGRRAGPPRGSPFPAGRAQWRETRAKVAPGRPPSTPGPPERQQRSPNVNRADDAVLEKGVACRADRVEQAESRSLDQSHRGAARPHSKRAALDHRARDVLGRRAAESEAAIRCNCSARNRVRSASPAAVAARSRPRRIAHAIHVITRATISETAQRAASPRSTSRPKRGSFRENRRASSRPAGEQARRPPYHTAIATAPRSGVYVPSGRRQ